MTRPVWELWQVHLAFLITAVGWAMVGNAVRLQLRAAVRDSHLWFWSGLLLAFGPLFLFICLAGRR